MFCRYKPVTQYSHIFIFIKYRIFNNIILFIYVIPSAIFLCRCKSIFSKKFDKIILRWNYFTSHFIQISPFFIPLHSHISIIRLGEHFISIWNNPVTAFFFWIVYIRQNFISCGNYDKHNCKSTYHTRCFSIFPLFFLRCISTGTWISTCMIHLSVFN